MGLIDDIHRFLEIRLEDFIRQNPRIELHILDEKLQQQEQEVTRLIITFEEQELQWQQQILALAEDVSLWHRRVQKAQAAQRIDLAQSAQEREAALLKQGNQVWAQMDLTRQRRQQVQDLLVQIRARRQEVQTKLSEIPHAPPKTDTSYRVDWQNLSTPAADDLLEQQFRRWELDEELEHLKQKMR